MERPGEGCHVAGCYVFLISAIHLSAASVLLLGNTARCPCYCNCHRVLKQIISRKSDKHIPSPTRVCKTAMPNLLLGQRDQPQEMGLGKEQAMQGQQRPRRGMAGGSFSRLLQCHVLKEILRGTIGAERAQAMWPRLLEGDW